MENWSICQKSRHLSLASCRITIRPIIPARRVPHKICYTLLCSLITASHTLYLFVVKCKIAFNNYDINCAKSGGGCLQSQINCQSLLRGASITLSRLLKSSLKCVQCPKDILLLHALFDNVTLLLTF